jgi:hypothetical protein
VEPLWNPATFPLDQVGVSADPSDLSSQPQGNQKIIVQSIGGSAPPWWHGSGIEIARATRSWIQYGTVAFAVICIVIGAVEALFGR